MDSCGNGMDSFMRALNGSPLSDILPSVNAPWTKFLIPRLDIPTFAPPLVRSLQQRGRGQGALLLPTSLLLVFL